MRKFRKKLALSYVFLGIIFFLVLVTFLFIKQEKDNARSSQSAIPTSTILPTSGSDLSYIKIVTDPDASLKILDMYDKEIGEATIQESIVDPVNPENKNESIKELNVQKPATGNYKLLIQGNTDAKFSIYFYDVNGDVSIVDKPVGGSASFIIFFDKYNNKKSYIKKIE